MMKIGISTGCLYPMLTEDSLAALTGLGFDTFEIFFNSFSELENDYLDRLHHFLTKHHLRIASVHPFTSSFESFLLFSNYERRFLDGVAFYERYFRTAQKLGAGKVILHGLDTRFRSTISDEEYCRRFAVLQEQARRYGTTLLQENVNRFRSSSNDFLAFMRERIPGSAAFVCDTKQCWRSGTTPLDTLRAMGDHLRHIHISGWTKDGQCALPGLGDDDLVPLFDYLHQIRYDGDMILEVYRFSFDTLPQLREAKQYLERLAKQYQLLP